MYPLPSSLLYVTGLNPVGSPFRSYPVISLYVSMAYRRVSSLQYSSPSTVDLRTRVRVRLFRSEKPSLMDGDKVSHSLRFCLAISSG